MAGALAGAWVAPSTPLWVAVAAMAVWGLGRRSRWSWFLLVPAIFLVTSASATRATAGLDFPDAGEFDGWVTLVDDPRASGPIGVRVTVRAGDRRLIATAHGAVGGRLDDALAGERVRLAGTVRPVGRDDVRSIRRHVVGRITVAEVPGFAEAAPVAAGANIVRRALADGASSLSRVDHALFLGMVIGDDRGQDAVTADDFRAAGLGHLLVVSGQNVAFVLAVAMPVAGRFRPGGRALLLLVLLGLFAVMTRFEPSVLRATVMAGVAIGSSALGRPTDGRAGLSWAVTALLVIDPFLVGVVAFQLSAAATAGIVWMSGPIAARLPGPAWLRVPVATTVAAQLAVSPLLIAIFGPMPLASLPANVLAGPASGAVMIWGCTAGLLAGLLGGTAATVLHWPTTALLWWVGEVARAAAVAPAATLDGPALALITVAIGVALLRGSRLAGRGSAAVITVVCAVAMFSAPTPAPGLHVLGDGVTIVNHGDRSIVVLDDPGPARYVLERLRLAGVRRPELVVAIDGDRADADAVLALRDRFGPLPIAAPPLHSVPGGRRVGPGQIIDAAGIRVEVLDVTPRMTLAVAADGGARAAMVGADASGAG